MKYLKDKKALRHGDILMIPCNGAKTKGRGQLEIHGGSHGHPHSIINGKFYPQRSGENILGYLKVNKDAYLSHAEHGEDVGRGLKQAPIEEGIYEVRVQVEDSHEGMVEVVD